MKMKSVLLMMIAAGVLATMSCSKSDPAPALSATTYSNLPADPPTGYSLVDGTPLGTTKKFTFFSFATGAIVANADSATTKWDLGFNSSTIIVNSGTSGPGTAAALVVTGVFNELNLAPDNGYRQDNKANTADPYAIPKGSGKGWYNYDGTANVITPIAGRVIMVKTSGDKYAKVEILSYYKDAPAAPTSTTPERYYTFRYVYQPDGTKKLQ